jgi:hypothetical protein
VTATRESADHRPGSGVVGRLQPNAAAMLSSDALDAPAQRLARYPPERDPANRRHRCMAAGFETSPLDHELVSELADRLTCTVFVELRQGRHRVHRLCR